MKFRAYWADGKRRQAYDAALAAGRTALDQQDYNEAERQAERALELIPRDHGGETIVFAGAGGQAP